jgi:Concanavalin A-like lectin/glucanases superfamily
MDLSYPRALVARRQPLRRRLALMAAAGMLAAVLPATVASTASPSAVDDPFQAASLARANGARVEALDLRTETSQTYANPDGTWTSDIFSTPQRVKDANGSWIAPDASLIRNADGSVSPKAATFGMAFSGGGDAPLVNATRGRAKLNLTWPGKLPQPEVTGDTVTYVEVLPGVDLKMRAEIDGFAELLVVKTREAGTNPALAKIKLGMSTTGVVAREGAGESVSWLDPEGRPVFSAGTSVQWDSAKAAATARTAAGDSSSADRSPSTGGKRSDMSITVDSGSLTISPDTAMLNDPATVFPVYIDPQVTPTSSNWSMINKIHPTTSYWAYDRNDGAKVGYEDYDDELYRSMFTFSTSSFTGATILGSKFKATLVHTASCTGSRVDLYKTGAFSSGTTWNNHASSWTPYLANKTAEACDDVAVPLEFTSSALTQQVQNYAGGSATITLGLRAYDETQSGHAGWKKFSTSTSLEVTYDRKPAVPTNLKSGGAACATGTNRPKVGTSSMQAYVDDSDSGDKLSVVFQWKKLNADGSYPATITGSQTLTNITPKTSPSVTPAFANGDLVAWQAQATDTSGIPSGWSGWCEMQIDTAAPGLPGITPPAGLYDSESVPTGDLGMPGTFALDPGAETDIVSYSWYLQGNTYTTATYGPVAADASGHATISVAPQDQGPNTLYVRSKDAAGNTSAWRPYTFQVAISGAVGYWRANEGSGTTLADDTEVATPHNGTLTGGVSWAPMGQGRVRNRAGDSALQFDGVDDIAAMNAGAVDTSRSFAVSLWATTTDTSTTSVRTLATQDGTNVGGFFFQKRFDKWAFGRTPSDAGGTIYWAQSTNAPVRGAWTHLVGVYDAYNKQIKLYVNGVLQQATSCDCSWNAAGSLVLGRTKYPQANTEPWLGAADDMRVWQRPVLGDQISAIANDYESGLPLMLGDWELEGDATDWSEFGNADSSVISTHTGVPTANVGFAGVGPDGSGAATFNGVDTAINFPGPVLRSDSSFTVSAWAKLDSLNTHGAVVSQDGTTVSAPFLSFTNTGTNAGRWDMIMIGDDSTSVVSTRAMGPAASLGVWTHLVGVYDAGQRQMRLYVNGSLAATAAFTADWSSNGSFAIGRALYGVQTNRFNGSIDQVKVFAGVLTDAQIANL